MVCWCCLHYPSDGSCSVTGSDYESLNQTKNAKERRSRFHELQTTSRDGNINITICDDSLGEDPESFEVYITDENLQNAFLSPYRVAMVTIVDNDMCEWCMVLQATLLHQVTVVDFTLCVWSARDPHAQGH